MTRRPSDYDPVRGPAFFIVNASRIPTSSKAKPRACLFIEDDGIYFVRAVIMRRRSSDYEVVWKVLS